MVQVQLRRSRLQTLDRADIFVLLTQGQRSPFFSQRNRIAAVFSRWLRVVLRWPMYVGAHTNGNNSQNRNDPVRAAPEMSAFFICRAPVFTLFQSSVLWFGSSEVLHDVAI